MAKPLLLGAARLWPHGCLLLSMLPLLLSSLLSSRCSARHALALARGLHVGHQAAGEALQNSQHSDSRKAAAKSGVVAVAQRASADAAIIPV